MKVEKFQKALSMWLVEKKTKNYLQARKQILCIQHFLDPYLKKKDFNPPVFNLNFEGPNFFLFLNDAVLNKL